MSGLIKGTAVEQASLPRGAFDASLEAELTALAVEDAVLADQNTIVMTKAKGTMTMTANRDITSITGIPTAGIVRIGFIGASTYSVTFQNCANAVVKKDPVAVGNYLWARVENIGTLGSPSLIISDALGGSTAQASKSLQTNRISDDSYITLPTTAGLYSWKSGASTLAGSISAWVKATALVADHMIFTDNDTSPNLGLTLQLANTGRARFFLYQTGTTTNIRVESSVLSVDTWYHICATWDNSNAVGGLNMYVDGVLDNDATAGTTITEKGAEDKPMIGISAHDMAAGDGLIHDVSFWNKALSLAEINDIISIHNGDKDLLLHSAVADLHSWFKTAGGVNDSSGQLRHGTPSSNIVYSVDVP